jgi:hypothetical protein
MALVLSLFLLLSSQPALGQEVPLGSSGQEELAGESTGSPPQAEGPAQTGPAATGVAPEDALAEIPAASPETGGSSAPEVQYAAPAPQEAPEPIPPDTASSPEPSSEPSLPPEGSPEGVPGAGGNQYEGVDPSLREGGILPLYAGGCGDGPQCPEPGNGGGPPPPNDTPPIAEDPCGQYGCDQYEGPVAPDPACEQYASCEQYEVPDPSEPSCERYGCDQYDDAPPGPADPLQDAEAAPLPPDDGSGFGDGGGSGLPPGQAPPAQNSPAAGTQPPAEQAPEYPIAGYPYEGVPCGEDNCGVPQDDPTYQCATFTTASGEPVVGCHSQDDPASEGCLFVDFYDENGAAYDRVESCDRAPVAPPEPPVRPSSVPDDYECGVVSETSLGEVQVCYDPEEDLAGHDCRTVQLYDLQGNFLGTTDDCEDGGGLFYQCGPDNCGAQGVPAGYTCQKVGPNPLWGDPGASSTNKIYCSPVAGEPTDGGCFTLIYDEQGRLLKKEPCDPQTGGSGLQAAKDHEDAVAALNGGAGREGYEDPFSSILAGVDDSRGAEPPRDTPQEAGMQRAETEEATPAGAADASPAIPAPEQAAGSVSPGTPIATSTPSGVGNPGAGDTRRVAPLVSFGPNRGPSVEPAEASVIGAYLARTHDLEGVGSEGGASGSAGGAARGSGAAAEVLDAGRGSSGVLPATAGPGVSGRLPADGDSDSATRRGDEPTADAFPPEWTVEPHRVAAMGPLDTPPAAESRGPAEQPSGLSPWLVAGASAAVAMGTALGFRRLYAAYSSRRR